mmetsp:Transcript_5251/g.9093  ORF Transcript_5251/g.9093 Transcript_5251/m.9093 type:complete len:225 (+) Transcript_5251:83-757(+)
MSERPRLNLKPRDESAAKAAETERAVKAKSNPFGDAKPRESVLAVRTGKTEAEIAREEVGNEALMRLRLSAAQQEEKGQLDALVDEIKRKLAEEEDPATKQGLELILKEREAAVIKMMEAVAAEAMRAAIAGEVQRPSERQEQRAREGGDEAGGGGGRGGRGDEAAFANFGSARTASGGGGGRGDEAAFANFGGGNRRGGPEDEAAFANFGGGGRGGREQQGPN